MPTGYRFRRLGWGVADQAVSSVENFLLGAIRGTEMLVGPIAAVLMGIFLVAVPEALRSLAGGRRALLRLCLLLSGGLATVSVAWALVLLLLFPLGPVWPSAQVLLLGVAAGVTFGCFHIGPAAELRAAAATHFATAAAPAPQLAAWERSA